MQALTCKHNAEFCYVTTKCIALWEVAGMGVGGQFRGNSFVSPARCRVSENQHNTLIVRLFVM